LKGTCLLGKNKIPTLADPLAELLPTELGINAWTGQNLFCRIGRYLLAAFALFGLLLWADRAVSSTSHMLIGVAVVFAFFAAPPTYLAWRIVVSLETQGQPVSPADRLAAVLCMALFTVPIGLFLLLAIAVILDLPG
jgi:hypothetical protein